MIALYKGLSRASRLIRAFHWSEYSHVAWCDPRAPQVFEAWKDKVRVARYLADNHTPGTPVDLFRVDVTRGQEDTIRDFLHCQVGKPYDWLGILHFVTRPQLANQAREQEKWFCSELVFAAYRAAGVNLLSRIPAWKVYPGLLAYSPLMHPAGSILTRPATEGRKRPCTASERPDALAPAHATDRSIAERATGFAETPGLSAVPGLSAPACDVHADRCAVPAPPDCLSACVHAQAGERSRSGRQRGRQVHAQAGTAQAGTLEGCATV